MFVLFSTVLWTLISITVYDFKATIDSKPARTKILNDPYTMSVKMDMNMSGKNIDDFWVM
jgi:hypothetical protein